MESNININPNQVNRPEELIGNSLDDFEILRELGGGGFGSVFKVKSKKNNKLYALKKLSATNEINRIKNRREIILLKYLNHENICKYYSEITTKDGEQFVLMEQYNNKDIYHYLMANQHINPKMKKEIIYNIIFQCFEGLSYLHLQGIIHCDIKLGNIFMTEEGKVVIGDFGISMVKNSDMLKIITKKKEEQELLKYVKDYRGSNGYAAPEVILKEGCDEKSDVYSLGVTFFVLLNICFPSEETKRNFYNSMMYSSELKELIIAMIEEDKNKRIDLSKAKEKFSKIYFQRYIKNSGIHSVTQCLLCFQNLKDDLTSNKRLSDSLDKKNKSINISLILNSIINDNDIEKNYFILKKYFSNRLKININDNNDISPLKIVFCLINSLNNDLNKIKNEQDEQKRKIINMKINPKNNDIQKFSENLYRLFDNSYKSLFKSIITDRCMGVLKVIWTCLECNNIYISFERYFSITFRIKESKINILDLFNNYNQSSFEIGLKKYITCENCKKYTKHRVNKRFYTLPNNLIIMFDKRKNKFLEIELKQEINFDKSIVETISDSNSHYLMGIIYENENLYENSQYVPLIKKEEKWYQYKYGQNLMEINIENIYKEISKNIVGLFYYKKTNIEKSLKDNNNNIQNKENIHNINANNNNNILNNNNNFMDVKTILVLNPKLHKKVNKINNDINSGDNNNIDNISKSTNPYMNQQNNMINNSYNNNQNGMQLNNSYNLNNSNNCVQYNNQCNNQYNNCSNSYQDPGIFQNNYQMSQNNNYGYNNSNNGNISYSNNIQFNHSCNVMMNYNNFNNGLGFNQMNDSINNSYNQYMLNPNTNFIYENQFNVNNNNNININQYVNMNNNNNFQ